MTTSNIGSFSSYRNNHQMAPKTDNESILEMRISGAGGYFAAPGSHPPKAGAFAPRKTVAQPSNLFTIDYF